MKNLESSKADEKAEMHPKYYSQHAGTLSPQANQTGGIKVYQDAQQNQGQAPSFRARIEGLLPERLRNQYELQQRSKAQYAELPTESLNVDHEPRQLEAA